MEKRILSFILAFIVLLFPFNISLFSTSAMDKIVSVFMDGEKISFDVNPEIINANGIPCRKVSGYSLGVSSKLKYWTEENAMEEETNHAWNQAYVDHRWINIDTTWNSGNKYENGELLVQRNRKSFIL